MPALPVKHNTKLLSSYSAAIFQRSGLAVSLRTILQRSDLKTFFKQISQIFFSSDETVCYVSLSILLIVTNQQEKFI